MIDEDNDDGLGGRSRNRREVNESRRYGLRLVALDPEVIAAVAMEDDLREAIALGRRIQSGNAKKRQIMFIERLLRGMDDAQIRPIERMLADPAPVVERVKRAADKTLDKTADALLADDDALSKWVAAHPEVDLPRLRTLIRNARKDPTRRAALLGALRGD